MHPPRKVRRWTCADCGEHGVGGAVDLFAHFDRAHKRDKDQPERGESAAVAQLVPDGDPDVKIAVELGMAILLDKPIVLIVLPGRRVPERLARVADALVEWDGRSDIADRVGEVMRDLVERNGGGS